MFVDLVNIFDSFLPQLLRYPNPSDPLNGEAAAMLMDNEEAYIRRVKDTITKYACVDFTVDDEGAAAAAAVCFPEGDRKQSSDTTCSSNSGGGGDVDDLKQSAEDEMCEEGELDDIDDNASDVSDMSDL
jgi:hypothetical protein